MSEPADRLRQLRIRKGYETAADAANAFGWNEHTYKSHENGTRGIRLDAARKYAAAFGSTPGHIMGIGNGTPAPEPVGNVALAPVRWRVAAGSFRVDDDEDFGEYAVPAVPRGDIASGLQYSVLVDGPSVNKRIADQSFAVCVPYGSFPGGAKHGNLVHVIRERSGLREHTIKEIQYTADGPILIPVSTDPRYQEPLKLSTGEDDEIVRIEGIVVGAFTPI